MHGKTSKIFHDGNGVFAGLPNPFEATRYHSLLVERASLPDCLEVTAKTGDEEIMGVRHKTLPVEGVQFHPESFLTTVGKDLLRNFLERGGAAMTHRRARRPARTRSSACARRSAVVDGQTCRPTRWPRSSARSWTARRRRRRSRRCWSRCA